MSDLIDDSQILVEFPIHYQLNQPGMEEVNLKIPSGKALAEKSLQALDSAMGTIRNMACRVIATIETLPQTERPSQAEVEFGINLNVEGNAAIAKAAAESNIKVKLTWESKKIDARS